MRLAAALGRRPAVALVGLELSRREAVLAGRRQLVGQVLEDLIRGSITTAEAERRLASFGIRAADDHALVVGTVDLSGDDLRRQLAVSPILPGATTAVVEDGLVAVLGPGQRPADAAEQMHAQLTRRGAGARVGIGGWYGGMTGLRWSYYEAHEAMSRGPGSPSSAVLGTWIERTSAPRSTRCFWSVKNTSILRLPKSTVVRTPPSTV